MVSCRKCGVELTAENCIPSRLKWYTYICNACFNKQRRDQWAKNPEKERKKARDWNRKNRDKRNRWNQESHLRNKIEVMSHYTNPLKCAMCPETDIVVLTIDHIKDDGADQRRQFAKEKGYAVMGSSFYYWLKKHNYPKGYQVLCANCQLRKRGKSLYSILSTLKDMVMK